MSSSKIILQSNESLHILKILRLVPYKRAVMLVEWHGKHVVAKLFSQKERANYEWQMYQKLMSANILIPKLLHRTTTQDRKQIVLLFEYLDVGQSCFELYKNLDVSKKLSLLKNLVQVIAKQHDSGFYQKDMHLNNFLSCEKDIFTLDLGGFVQLKASNKIHEWKIRLKNLALLFAQFNDLTDENVHEVLKFYTKVCKKNACDNNEKEFLLLLKQIMIYKEERKNKWLRKIFRNCSQFYIEKKLSYHLVCEKKDYDNLKKTLINLDEVIDSNQAEYIKQGNTCTVVRVWIESLNRYIIVKRYNVKNIWHFLRKCFRKTRAAICWRNSHMMEFYGIACAHPIAFVEKKIGWLNSTSYFLSEYVEGVRALDYFNQADVEQKSTQQVAENIAQLLNQLKIHHIKHGDMKATNILLVDSKPVLLDLDAMRQYRFQKIFNYHHQKDIVRFMKNWIKNPAIFELFRALLY